MEECQGNLDEVQGKSEKWQEEIRGCLDQIRRVYGQIRGGIERSFKEFSTVLGKSVIIRILLNLL